MVAHKQIAKKLDGKMVVNVNYQLCCFLQIATLSIGIDRQNARNKLLVTILDENGLCYVWNNHIILARFWGNCREKEKSQWI